jgi:hypothetical protein
MLRLEIELQNERNIALKMCQYLPGKTNKQIRDKRAEATYKARRDERLLSYLEPQEDNTRKESENNTEKQSTRNVATERAPYQMKR